MSIENSLLYLSDADVSKLSLDPDSVRLAIEQAFQAYAAGQLRTEPKTSIVIGPGHAFQSLSAVDAAKGFAAVKWVGMVPPGVAAATNINASILLSDSATGQTRCLMDGRRVTAVRTAGMTAVAARYLAREDSASIGFVGAGVQAESHLVALRSLLPSLRNVYIHSGASPTGARLAQRCVEMGLDAMVVTAQETVANSDIVVTTVPVGPGFKPFIDAAWIRPGAFVAAVDLGRSWLHEGLEAVDLTVVDELALKTYAKPANMVPPLDYAQASLSDLVAFRHPGRANSDQRILLVSSGSAVADLAIAMLTYERALGGGVGTLLSA